MITSTIKKVAVAAFTFAAITASAQQLKVPAPSPSQTIKQAFALSDITVEYSRPGVKGRVVFGDVVPFGKVWRTGANAATQITFGEDVTVEGKAVKAGIYALYTVPNKDAWEIMLYKDLKLGGNVNDYKKEDEVLRFSVKPVTQSTKTETFTINIADVTNTTANIELIWDQTKVSFKVQADIDAKIMKNIDASLANDTRPYFQAASYYYENNKDLKQALDWANKATDNNPKAFWMWMLKAKIQAKLGEKKAAVETAQNVILLAKEAKNDDYVKMAEKLISENK
ncbi:MAG: DUF2911 domain-containing protein [Bacteroidetes bacterium]|nr:DUF2911 domain-containing protein [Bacteroidota bacterium]